MRISLGWSILGNYNLRPLPCCSCFGVVDPCTLFPLSPVSAPILTPIVSFACYPPSQFCPRGGPARPLGSPIRFLGSLFRRLSLVNRSQKFTTPQRSLASHLCRCVYSLIWNSKAFHLHNPGRLSTRTRLRIPPVLLCAKFSGCLFSCESIRILRPPSHFVCPSQTQNSKP